MGILDLGRYKGIVFAITGFLVFIAIILAVNHGKAGQFSDNVAGVKFLVQQQTQPRTVYDAGMDLAAKLKSGQKIDETLETLRKAATSYDQALSGLTHGAMITTSAGEVIVLRALSADEAATALAANTKLWDGAALFGIALFIATSRCRERRREPRSGATEPAWTASADRSH
jgi:two-component system chemotaxis sensor kinase CheA